VPPPKSAARGPPRPLPTPLVSLHLSFFYESGFHLVISFSLIHFHMASQTLLQEIFFLVFRMPNKWKWIWRYSIVIWWIWILSFLLNQIWNGIDDIPLNFFATFGQVLGLQVTAMVSVFKSVEIVWCVCLYFDPCLWPAKQVWSIVYHVI